MVMMDELGLRSRWLNFVIDGLTETLGPSGLAAAAPAGAAGCESFYWIRDRRALGFQPRGRRDEFR